MVKVVAEHLQDQYTNYVVVEDLPGGMTYTGEDLIIDGRRYYMALPYPPHRIGIMVPGGTTSSRYGKIN